MTNEELIAEAKLKYPIGCLVECLYSKDNNSGSHIRTIEKHTNNHEHRVPDEIWFHNPLAGKNVQVYNRGIWAERIDAPQETTYNMEVEYNMQELLEEAKTRFPEGCLINQAKTFSSGKKQLVKGPIQLYSYSNTNDMILSGDKTAILWYKGEWAEMWVDPNVATMKKLQEIVAEENIENIDIQQEGFMISWGDLLNQYKES